MKRGLIFMTALVPTMGHRYLIDFAETFLAENNEEQNNQLIVIVSGRSHEPIASKDRISALDNSYKYYENLWTLFYNHQDDLAPQNPDSDNDEAFWEYWKNVVKDACNHHHVDDKIDYVFASEKYGHKVAEILGAEFIPVDIKREVVSARGTYVRMNLMNSGRSIINDFRNRYLLKEVTIFGQESVGKTTIAKALAKELNGVFCHEWARPYLEEVGPEITEEKMLNICRGQTAAEVNAVDYALENGNLVVLRDTDLLSTFGYYKLWNQIATPEFMLQKKIHTADLYLVLKDNIPFEADPLRYGGDKRETDTQFWIDILEEFGVDYVVIESSDLGDRLHECKDAIMNHRNSYGFSFNDIITFQRD